MDNLQIGRFIAELRKEKNMTQKELAALMNVTDKAVSKWERGLGYPEITLIPQLANAFGITTNELLSGHRAVSEMIEIQEVDGVIYDTIEYMDRNNKHKLGNMIAGFFTAFLLLGVFTCLVVNYAVSQEITWAMYPVGASVIGWCTVIPVLLIKKHKALWSLVGAVATVIPYLLIIESMGTKKGWVVSMALPIIGVSVGCLLIVILLFFYTPVKKLYVAGISVFLMGVLANLLVNRIVANYLNQENSHISNTIIALGCGFLALLVMSIGYFKSPKTVM